jgi:hypothetical protein
MSDDDLLRLIGTYTETLGLSSKMIDPEPNYGPNVVTIGSKSEGR